MSKSSDPLEQSPDHSMDDKNDPKGLDKSQSVTVDKTVETGLEGSSNQVNEVKSLKSIASHMVSMVAHFKPSTILDATKESNQSLVENVQNSTEDSKKGKYPFPLGILCIISSREF